MISIFTTYTDPEKRSDPWKEALECYNSFADEVIIEGGNWPYEFKWDLIGKTFQKGFDKCSGDWVIRMDIDYFFHEKDFKNIKNTLLKNPDQPAISFPQYQFFTHDRFQVKTRLCVALNKKAFPKIKLNGGGDLCLATIDNKIINPHDVPNCSSPIYQYDSYFRDKETIAEDRARFARAWFAYFNSYGDRGGKEPEEAYEAWFEMIKSRYVKHTNKISLSKHPKFIKERLGAVNKEQFGFDAFGLKDEINNRRFKDYISGYKNRFVSGKIINWKASN